MLQVVVVGLIFEYIYSRYSVLLGVRGLFSLISNNFKRK